MTKDQTVIDLGFKTKVFLWSAITLSSLSIGILGSSALRNWHRWKEQRCRKRAKQQQNWKDVDAKILAEEEAGEIPDKELCVICLAKKRQSAFIPCGHLVCCEDCASSVDSGFSPKCPVCRQVIQSKFRIYES